LHRALTAFTLIVATVHHFRQPRLAGSLFLEHRFKVSGKQTPFRPAFEHRYDRCSRSDSRRSSSSSVWASKIRSDHASI
jgi:hypothetical protein